MLRARWLALSVLVLACGRPSAGPKARPAPLVTTTVVTAEDVPVLVRAPIDLKPLVQADIGVKTVGVLDAVLVDRGDPVKKGQLLALVRPSDLPDQLAAAKSALAQAEASRALAKANLERGQALAPRGLVSQQELQNMSTAAASTEAQAAAAQSQLAALATRLGETRLEAPFDGVVVSRRLDPGALVGPSSGAVLTVARVDVVRAFVAVTEREAVALRVGQPAWIELDALPNRRFQGKVERLSPTFDVLTRTLDAEVHLPNEARELRPGMYGRGEIEVGRHPGMPVVPVESVQLFDDKAFVYVVSGQVVKRQAVTLGEDMGSRLEVSAGLQAGDEVVVRGIDALSDGAKIRKAQTARPDAGLPAAAVR